MVLLCVTSGKGNNIVYFVLLNYIQKAKTSLLLQLPAYFSLFLQNMNNQWIPLKKAG
jgi:hypothetical protein